MGRNKLLCFVPLEDDYYLVVMLLSGHFYENNSDVAMWLFIQYMNHRVQQVNMKFRVMIKCMIDST